MKTKYNMSLCVNIFIFLCLFSHTKGSYITFDKTSVPSSPTLTLRCSLKANSTSAQQQDTSGSGDVLYVTSLTVTRNHGDQVAAIFPVMAATAYLDPGNLAVEGKLTDTQTAEHGYLELTWQQPTPAQTDQYTCEVNGITSKGHNLAFSRSLDVKVTPPVVSSTFITFGVTPDVIKTYFTPSLTLRCSLSFNMTSTSGQAQGQGDKAKVKVSRDVKFVTSVVVTRGDGEQVASVLPYSTATGFVDTGRLSVEGHLSHTEMEQGYLTLTWRQPDIRQSGNYTCEVNGINQAGHNLVYSNTLEVKVIPPTVDDLIYHVHLLEVRNENLERKLDEMVEMVNKTAPTGPLHIENGTIQCHPQNGTNVDKTQTFRVTYDLPPIVHLGVTGFLANTSIQTYMVGGNYVNDTVLVGHYVQLSRVDVKSFSITCPSTRAAYNFDYLASVDWISFPVSSVWEVL